MRPERSSVAGQRPVFRSQGSAFPMRVLGHVLIIICLATTPLRAACPQLATACWAGIDEAINSAVEAGTIPGAVLLVGQDDRVLVRTAYGNRSVEPARTPMTVDTIFDLASCSKVIGTATSVMVLVDQNRLRLTDKVSQYLPAFSANGKGDITIEQLLLHRAGLIADNDLSDYRIGPAEALAKINALKTLYPPGSRFEYSDVGFIVLGEIVRIVSGRPLDQFAREAVFERLHMRDTGYRPAEPLRVRCAPTEKRDDHWMIGEVHDPRAYLLGGVAGHAGLFSTADDMARYCRMILNRGEIEGRRILSANLVAEMTRAGCLGDDHECRGYGWDIDTGYSSPRGRLFAHGTSIGHTGYTGTSMWLDLPSKTYLILLTNSVHPKDQRRPISALRREVGTLVAAALMAEGKMPVPVASAPSASQPHARDGRQADVLCGIDVLERDHFKILQGRTVALITNHTGRDRQGRRTVDILAKAAGVKLAKLFSPEHGLYGVLDETVGNTTDKQTGLPVFSLYGQTRRLTAEMLEGIDTIVFDIQDIGARYYTYPATLAYAMEEAARRHIKVVVLDRPNPITGLIVDGPVADSSKLGFTACMEMPVAHGMTIGELAKMFNLERRIGCELSVVPVEGWNRAMWWDETGLTWINPSPNMRNLNQALLYLSVGLLETTNLSVGRGTDQPFEQFGAPWIDGPRLSAQLNAANLPGLRFYPIDFTPNAREFKGKVCHGVFIVITDRTRVEPVRSGLTMAWALRKLFGSQFAIEKVNNLMASDVALAAVKTTDDPAGLPAVWGESLNKFRQMRQKYLMYP